MAMNLDLPLRTIDEQSVTLRDLSRDGPMLLIFLRHLT
jgi:hypothetical protein